jgi:hypothetical protein
MHHFTIVSTVGQATAPTYPCLSILPATFLSFSSPTIAPFSIMSAAPSTSTCNFDFVSIFSAALETYKRKTDKDLASHPLLPSLQYCDSPEDILTVLREQIPTFSQSQNGDDRLTKWVTPTVNVLYAFSTALSQGVGPVNIKCFFVKNSSSNITFRHSHRQMQYLRGSAFSSWSVSFIVPLCYFDTKAPRPLKMRVLARTSSFTSSIELNVSLAGLRFMLESHRLRLCET